MGFSENRVPMDTPQFPNLMVLIIFPLNLPFRGMPHASEKGQPIAFIGMRGTCKNHAASSVHPGTW